MILVLSLPNSSNSVRARMMTVPRPVMYAWRMPERPRMMPFVGKSGPVTCCKSSFIVASGLSSTQMHALMTSVRLCGGMFVAMPTAIPDEPFTSRFGNLDGSTRGSLRVSSKFGSQSTVSFSISRSISSDMRAMRASV